MTVTLVRAASLNYQAKCTQVYNSHLIRMAWEDTYDIAVLVTSDSDLVPCVEYLSQTPRRVIQARFAPNGGGGANVCEASFDLTHLKQEILRT